jgi:hypothetical protein
MSELVQTMTEPYIDLDIDLVQVKDEKATSSTKVSPAPSTSKIVEDEDLIDYDDYDLMPAKVAITLNDEDIKIEEPTAIDKPTAIVESIDQAAPTPEEQAVQTRTMLTAARSGMQWGTQAMLIQSPQMASALRLNRVGDAVTVQVSANDCTYDITWKVTKAPISSTNAAPPAPRCKFGRTCTKGAACAYSHTKLCTWVNTIRGCDKREECEFSHELKSVKCTRSVMRKACENGVKCAYQHKDDVKESTPEGVKNAYPQGSRKEGAGQKRGREEEGKDRRVTQRPRFNDDYGNGGNNRGSKQHRGQGRDQVRGRGAYGRGNGRGRGGANAARPEMHIRGFAARDER